MSDRERLVEIIGGVQWNAKAEQVADALLAAGVTLPPAPPPVLEVTDLALAAWNSSRDICREHTYFQPDCMLCCMEVSSALRASFPHLLRSCADGLTDAECEAIASEIGTTDGSGLIRTILRRVAARREA